MKGRMFNKGKHQLTDMYNKTKKYNRQQGKRNDKAYNGIYAKESLKKHLATWKHICEWADQHGYKYKDFDNDMMGELLKDEADKYAVKTLKSYVSTANKMLQNTEEKPLKLRDYVKYDTKTVGNVYKSLTGEEWKQRNKEIYQKYQDNIKVIEAFGLRDKELKQLNEKSFIIEKGRIAVRTIGKGGKYRVARCTQKLNNEMMNRFSKYINTKYVPSDKRGIEKERYEKDLKTAKPILKNTNTHMYPRHIFRAEYAKQYLKETDQKYDKLYKQIKNGPKPVYKGYSQIRTHDELANSLRKNIIIQIGAYKGHMEAFLETSQQLGHNRLDVLLRYLR